MSATPGQILSHFRIASKIGEGGMGIVYRAEDIRLRRQVALKVLPPDVVGNEERRRRFLREARLAAAVNHPNIATIHEIDEADGVVFIAMELVDGETLRSLIRRRSMSMDDVLRFATQMAEGLAEAHKAHIIHRDLKPDNAIVTSSGHLKILDFGLARLHQNRDEGRRSVSSRMETVTEELTRERRIVGTPAYMSPEQARGLTVDARSDLFAFGVTLYEMTTGRVPFQGQTAADTISAIIRDAPIPPHELNPEAPQALERIIDRCLQKDPSARYQRAEDLSVALRNLIISEDPARHRLRSRRSASSAPPRVLRRGVVWGPLAALVALAVFAGIASWQHLQPGTRLDHGHRFIVTEIQSAADQSDVAVMLRSGFEQMLASSRLIVMVRGEQLRSLISKGSSGSAITVDERVAHALCDRSKIDGFISSRLSRTGSSYSLARDELRHVDVTPRIAGTS